MAGQQILRGGHDGLYEQLITVYNVVLIVGLVLNVLVVSVAYVSRRVQRCRSWYMFMMSWIILSLSFLFLLGQQTAESTPMFGICLAQAVLVYAAPPLTAFSTLILVVNLYFGLSGGCTKPTLLLLLSMLLPPVVYLSIIVEATAIGLTNRHQVQRDHTGMYCHIALATPAIVTFAVIGLSVILMVGFIVAIVLTVRKSASFVGQKVSAATVPLGIIVRIGVFAIAPISVLVLEALIMLQSKSMMAMSITAIMYAVLPLLAALTFGTQADILGAMIFWRSSTEVDEGAMRQPAV